MVDSGPNIQAPDPVNPYKVSQADFAFNRLSQFTPTSNLQFFQPGQTPTVAPQQVGFSPRAFTQDSFDLLNIYNPASQPTPANFKGGGFQSRFGDTPSQFVVDSAVNQFNGGSPTGFGSSSGGVGSKGGTPTSQSLPAGAGDFIAGAGGFNGAGSKGGTPTSGSGSIAPRDAAARGLNATAIQTLPPELLALENLKLTTGFNTLADTVNRQQAISEQGLPDIPTELDLSGLPQGGNIEDPDAFNRRIERAIFEQGSQNLQRDFERQFDTVQQTLENRGIPLGTEAADRTINAFGEAQSDALQDLAFNAVIGGGAESSRAFADRLAAVSGREGLRGQRIGEQLTGANLAQSQRSQTLNELNVLLGLPQLAQPPIQSFLPTQGTGVVDAFGLNVAGQNARAQTQAQLASAQKGGISDLIGSLGGAAIGGIFR